MTYADSSSHSTFTEQLVSACVIGVGWLVGWLVKSLLSYAGGGFHKDGASTP